MRRLRKVLGIAATLVLGSVAGLPSQRVTEFAEFTGLAEFTGFTRVAAEPSATVVGDRATNAVALQNSANPQDFVNPNLGNPVNPGNPENLANPETFESLANQNPGNPVNPVNSGSLGNGVNRAASAIVPSRISATTTSALFEQRPRASASPQTAGTTVVATSERAAQPWDAAIEQMSNDGELRLRRTTGDPLIAGLAHEQFDQFYKGVPVYGGGLNRQTDRGTTVSVFGTIYPDIDLDITPRLSAEEVRVMVELARNVTIGPSRAPQLLVLPDAGAYRLVYRVVVFSIDGGTEYFIDAANGSVVLQRDAMERQNGAATIARGTGVLGDDKKVSVMNQSGAFFAWDLLRPPAILTFDMKGDINKTISVLGGAPLTMSDLSTTPSTSTVWTDQASVDAQAYSGYVYDFYFKRFGRRGLDNNDIPLVNIVHPVRRQDAATTFATNRPVFDTYFVNAFYAGGGVMVYGEGLPSTSTLGGLFWNYLAGGLDVIAHELTHGVTDFTSNLIYQDESGALNEAFSDIMGTAVEFYFQPVGTGFLKADYLLGEDVITPGGLRSMANPTAYGDPDHYSNRFTGTADNGGVHTNSAIASHAYYLAIEGGTNQTSGLAVQGVGTSNRAQIENVFYRAFTLLMPSNATFSTARSVTILSAQQLYGAGSAPVQAVTQAWTAVGVN